MSMLRFLGTQIRASNSFIGIRSLLDFDSLVLSLAAVG